MSTSREQGAVLYVVSRSGKILGSDDRPRRFVEADYFEGELEGWIFWGSSKTSTASIGSKLRQDASGPEHRCKGPIGNLFGSLRRKPRKKRIPFLVWGDETFNDVISPVSWRQTMSHWSKNIGRMEYMQGGRDAEMWKDTETGCESSLSDSALPHLLFRSERYRMDQNVKIGLSQLAILQKWDAEWEPGTRELAARWAAWLLKVLRKCRPRPLQHLLFTMCAAVLPVICCSLIHVQWTKVPDPELCRCVDIVWKAVDKSYACFSQVQWEILEERLIECQKIRMKIGKLTENDPEGAVPVESMEIRECKRRKQEMTGMSCCWEASRDLRQSCCDASDEQLSNTLVRVEGVSGLVRHALREKLITPQSKPADGAAGFSGASGTIVSLVCPLSGRRVKVPARGRGCSHLTSFDLQAYLEGHANNNSPRCSFVHQRKKPKVEKGAWCCPICGSDATWPQIVVDSVLLRILEVLPEDMLQVCLLPNGGWRLVWSPIGENPGKIDTRLTAIAVRTSSKFDTTSGRYYIGRFGELRLDAIRAIDHCSGQEKSCGWVGKVLQLDKAYRAWEGADHCQEGDSSKQVEVQWGAESTFAVWTGDQSSSIDSLWQASGHNPLNLREIESASEGEITGSGSIKAEGNISTEKISGEDNETENSSRSKLILEALQALGGLTSVCSSSGGIYARMRVGQNKARPKLMARKT